MPTAAVKKTIPFPMQEVVDAIDKLEIFDQYGTVLSCSIPYEVEVAEAFWDANIHLNAILMLESLMLLHLWRVWPTASDHLGPVITGLQAEAVDLRRLLYLREGVIAILEEEVETRERDLARLRSRAEHDGYSVEDVGYGDLVDQINDALATIASDIHRRGQIDEPRKISVSIKGEPSESSSAVSWSYEVTINLAKSKGGGTAYLDKTGRLMRPEQVGAEQIMLPVDGKRVAA